jgi:hypothetical protein
VKLNDELGPKGLNIIALTGEAQNVLRAYVGTSEPSIDYPVALGGGGAYQVTGVPYAVLVGADGKVLWEGNGAPPGKEIEAAVKAVKLTPEQIEAKAGKRVAYAQKFAEDKLFARAEYELQQVVKLHASSEAAKKAQEVLSGFQAPEIAAELAAQKEVAKMIGLVPNLERPSDKMKGKEMESMAKKLKKKADDIRTKTPRAAKLAEEWMTRFELPWAALREDGTPMNPKK